MMCDLHEIGVSIGDNFTGRSIPPRNISYKIQQKEEYAFLLDDVEFEPNIFIYDNYPGGIGLSPSLFDLEKELLIKGMKTIEVCP